MAIYASAGTEFTPAPAGLHQGVCVDVVDMGVLKVTYGDNTKEQHKVRIVWQIDTDMESGKPFIVQKRYTLSLNEKATLRKDLESWRGRAFTQDELKQFDLEKLIGANCQVNIQHTQKNGSTYANVVTIVPIGRGMGKIEGRAYVRAKDRDPKTAEYDDNGGAGMSELTLDDIPF